MFVFYCFQKNKFLIIEDFGCCNEYYPSIAAFLVIYGPPLQLMGATVILGCITLHHVISRRSGGKFLSGFLMSRDPALSSSQTFRLIALSILLAIPASVWVVGVYQQVAYVGFKPLPSWDAIHAHSNLVSKLKAGKITTLHRNSLLMRWWSILTDGYLVFALFGTSNEVIMEYHRMWLWFKTAVFKYPPPVPEKEVKEVKKLDTSDDASSESADDLESDSGSSKASLSLRVLKILKVF